MYPTYKRYWQGVVDRPEDLLPGTGEPPQAEVIAFARWAASTPHVVLSRIKDRTPLAAHPLRPPGGGGGSAQATAGRTIYVAGGAQTVASLMNADLIDEWRLVLHPLALGAGKPLFGTLEQRRPFALIGSRAQADGSVRLTCRRG